MKKNILLVVYIIVGLLIYNYTFCQNNDKAFQKTNIITSVVSDTNKKIIKYKVYGMDCPGCQGALEKQLKKIPWVSNAKANWIKQEVEIYITTDSLVVYDEILKRIKKANFTPGEKINLENEEN